MQMNVLHTKQVSHVGSGDDHGQSIAGGVKLISRRAVVEFYLYPTVSTVLIHSVKPELTE